MNNSFHNCKCHLRPDFSSMSRSSQTSRQRTRVAWQKWSSLRDPSLLKSLSQRSWFILHKHLRRGEARLCRREITGKYAIKLWQRMHRPDIKVEREVYSLVFRIPGDGQVQTPVIVTRLLVRPARSIYGNAFSITAHYICNVICFRWLAFSVPAVYQILSRTKCDETDFEM
jgi:hypothetical protein